MRAHKTIAAVALLPALALAVACGSDKPKTAAPASNAAAAPAAAAPAASAAAKPAASGSAAASASAGRAEFHEEDFAESERSRDPFRSYSLIFGNKNNGSTHGQRAVMLERYSVEQLKLVALVTHTDEPRAMLVDPTGRGTVVTRGQYVGRAEMVKGGGDQGAEYELNWRVDRIRETDVLLVREDSAHPEIAPATKTITLPKDPKATEQLETTN